MVPYRDAKLTRLFQSYFTGRGKASMVVNISQSPYLFDESLQVLKFSAIASKVSVEIFKEPEEPQTVKKRPPPKGTGISKATSKTRFSMLMEKKAVGNSVLSGRGSIAWENPALSSTQKIRNTLSAEGTEATRGNANPSLIPEEATIDAKMEESSVFETFNENDETEMQDTTVVDQRYDGLLKVIDNLKVQLIADKQKNLLLERKIEKVEKDVRAELCEEFNQMMVEIESNWEQRLQEEKDRASELSEWRISKVEEAYMEKRKKRKRSEDGDKHNSVNDNELEAKLQRIGELELIIEGETKEHKQLEEQVEAMKEVHQRMLEDQQKEREKLTRQSFEMANQKGKFKEFEETISRLKSELEATNQALDAQSADPKIKELEGQVEASRKAVEALAREKTDLEALLEEAGEEYQTKDRELSNLREQLTKLKNELTEQELRASDQDNEIQECRALLEEANSRADEKEFLVEERDSQIMELEEKLENLKKEHEQQDNTRWMEKKAADQQLSELNDEVENLKEQKKKLKAQTDSQQSSLNQKNSEIEKQDSEISKLQNEIKSLIQAEKQQRDAKSEIEAEEVMLRKQVKDLTLKLSEVDTLRKSLKDTQTELETTVMELETTKKENSVTEVLKTEFEALRSDKEQKSKETANLLFKIEKLQADVNNAEYDAKRLKEDKHKLMDHYEKQMKKKDAEMVTLRKRFDPNRTVEILNNATPNKKIEQNEHEISSLKETIDVKNKELKMLREELESKSELVKKLASQITSPVTTR